MNIDPAEFARPQPSFGAWLLRQKDRGGLIGMLAKGAAADRAFPRDGSPEDVRARLDKLMADGDTWEALEDAERAWGAQVSGQ